MTEVERVVHAVLYEGYALYPYRPSALKNQRRFAFGVVYPRAWAERTLDPSCLRCEVIAIGGDDLAVTASVRFLRLARGGGSREERIDVDASRVVDFGDMQLEVELVKTLARPRTWRCAIEVRNVTESAHAHGHAHDDEHERVMDISPASTLAVLTVAGGEFLSAIDPASIACRSSGLYAVLLGPTAMLASPIILADRPEIAPESPGDFFEGTEMDEMLTLRILTMTPAERHEARAADPRVAALIARTEQLGIEQTARLHGVVRTPWPREGTRVRLCPGRRADAFDLILAGKLATVAKVERDLEGQIFCAVTIDDDPGADLGRDGMPGHRFLFRPEELEVLA